MNKRDETLIKLLGVIAGQLVVIATNLADSNINKIATDTERTRMLKNNSQVMASNLNLIDKIIKEVIND